MSIVMTVAPLLLTMSTYTQFTAPYCVAAVGFAFLGNRAMMREKGPKEQEQQIALMNGLLKPFLSNYRAAMMLATCTAILAVDFNLFFPVRFAKCEEYGISLMDVGVGGFIFSSALTSAKARVIPQVAIPSSGLSSKAGKESSPTTEVSRNRSTWLSRQLQALKVVVPLLVLGLGRFTIIKAFGYQEHVSEYGMHWNFFMTLAGITLLASALSIPLSYSALVASFILVAYHYLLEGMGVAQWIIEAPRDTFFSQNREGILSCWGYFALYLFGQQVGAYLLQPRTRKQWWVGLAYLTIGGFILWAGAFCMYYFLDMHASRRMVNLPYALYTLSCNFLILSAFILVDLLEPAQPHPLIDSVATKRNSQLVIFTLANLMTGAMNVFIGTYNRPIGQSFLLMSLYMSAVSLVALFWHPALQFVFRIRSGSTAASK
jgi:phosphatidylinositol glycan class W